MSVRPATAADADAIAQIWNAEIRKGVSTFTTKEKAPDDVRALIAARAAFFVADYEGVLGFATYGAFRDGPGYSATVESTVYIAPKGQGRGYGRSLMTQIEDAARAEGVHVIVAGVGHENTQGLAFHQHLGFVQVARLPEVGRKFDRWMDLVLLQKIL